jgi:hypothetical protein
LTPEWLGFAARNSARALVFCVAALLPALTLQAAQAETLDVASVTPLAVPSDIAEIRTQPALGTTAMPVAAGQQKLTDALLANYVVRQRELSDFHAFGLPNKGELTEERLLGYIARGSLGGGNGALDAIATFTSEPQAKPALTQSVLASYIASGFLPTVKRVEIANEERGCLAQAIYHEARGESAAGQLAVANIIVNRANSGRYPDSLCGVIYQNADKGRYRCQFTFACDGRSDAPRERRAWARSKQLAEKVYVEYAQGEGVGALPKSALFYHTTAVWPSWASAYTEVAQIGSHIFYAPN